jgi:chromosome partitioning protein
MAPVSDAPDLAARGRAIFDQLRSEADRAPSDDEPSEPTDDATATPAEEADGSATPVEPAAAVDAESDGAMVTTVELDPAPAPTEIPAMAPIAAPATALVAPTSVDADVGDDVTAPNPVVEPPPDLVVEPPPDVASAATEPAVARDLPRVLAIANQKGGVGKTTTAVNLGAALADLGFRVLVVDLDPQGNASTGLGINVRDLQTSMYDVILHDVSLDDCVEATSVRNLFVAPASLDLAGAEIELVPAFSRELRLKRALDEVRDDYDYVLIDCPPSLGLLTVNSLAAAGEVLVPIQCEYYALEGLGQLVRNVALVQKNLNHDLEVSTIVLVMYDARTKLSDQVVTEVRNHFGARVCRTVIPRTVRLSEAPSYGQPIIAFDPTSRGAIAYRELAKEVSGGTPQRAG